MNDIKFILVSVEKINVDVKSTSRETSREWLL